jgi:2-polyprenyl-6-methoxyphenol hydroxylase-like FAD-dependent oxidoreductase
MNNHSSPVYDVVIAGAGPVGLFLACELRLANVSVLLLEQSGQPRSPLKRLPFGLRGLSVPTAEALYRRGLLNAVMSPPDATDRDTRMTAAAHWRQSQQARHPAGHFAGIQFFQEDIDTSRWRYRLPTPAQPMLAVEMEHLETVLSQRALELGALIERGCRVERVEQSLEEVAIHTRDDIFHARWLVGCDGGRSNVRKLCGFEFVGTEPEFTGYSIEVELADPDALRPGRHYTSTGMYTYSKPGTIAMVEFDAGACHGMESITLEDVQGVLRRVSSTDVDVKAIRLATTWTDRARQVSKYRNSRVLLAGDAAHIHSPLGGQGLNLGLGDAMNLGWKLASTIRNEAPADLLDSYHCERHPIGAQILDWSRAQVAIMRPTPSTRALESIIRDLIGTRDGATYFAERVWGMTLRYDVGSAHPLAGGSAPDIELIDGSKLGTLMSDATALFLDFDSRAELRELVDRWQGRIGYVARAAVNRLGLSALLVRPDGFVAWASDSKPEVDAAAQAMSRWFGPPNNSHHGCH